MIKPDVLMVLFDAVVSRTPGFSSVDLNTQIKP
jgi:hypothetical protein